MLRYLHCADNTANVAGDKLRKLRSIVDMLNVFLTVVFPKSVFVGRWVYGWNKVSYIFSAVYAKKKQEIWHKIVGFMWTCNWLLSAVQSLHW